MSLGSGPWNHKYDSLQSKCQKSKYNTAEASNATSYEGKKKTSGELPKGFAWGFPLPLKKKKIK